MGQLSDFCLIICLILIYDEYVILWQPNFENIFTIRLKIYLPDLDIRVYEKKMNHL